MKISFICNPVYINGGWSPWDTRLGGSEECIVQWSRRLAKDHEVSVFHNGKHGEYEGVQYKDHSDYEPGDITVNVNYPQFKPQGRTIYWSTLTDNPDLTQFDAVAGLSKYALEHTNLHHENLYILPCGFDKEEMYPEIKIYKQCLYASSPDRGLSTLLDVWPQVYETHPDALLLVTYGAEPQDIPGVMFMGDVPEDVMNELFRTSDIWCHPCNGGELYCVSGIKAQEAGAIPVIIPTMALAETVVRGFKVTEAKDYAQSLIEVLNMSEIQRDGIRLDVKSHSPGVTWEESTNKLLEIINSVVH